MFKNVQSPKHEEMFKFAMIITVSIFVVVTLVASYGLSSLI